MVIKGYVRLYMVDNEHRKDFEDFVVIMTSARIQRVFQSINNKLQSDRMYTYSIYGGRDTHELIRNYISKEKMTVVISAEL